MLTGQIRRTLTLLLLATAAPALAKAAPDDLDQRIARLEAALADLEGRAIQSAWARDQIIADLLHDADRRTGLLSDAPADGAGYGSAGFFVRSGPWSFRPGAQLQFRSVANYHESGGDDSGDSDDLDHGFEIRRLRFTFGGTAFTEALRYRFQWTTRTNGGELRLTDAWVEYALSEAWAVRLGQFKDPVHREQLVPSRNQLPADRTIVNEVIGGGINGRTQGVGLSYGNYEKAYPVNIDLVIHDGANQTNTASGSEEFDFGFSARVEWKLHGDWASYRDFTAKGTRQSLAVLGAAASWSQSGDGDLFTGTVDFHWESASRLGVFAALLVADAHDVSAFVLPGETAWGGLVQVSYLLTDSWDLFGRVDFTHFADPYELSGGGEDDLFPELTVGLSHYFGEGGSALHRAKLVIDLTYLPDGLPAQLLNPETIGAIGDDEQWLLRAQFQLII
jgi:hypothetical protein